MNTRAQYLANLYYESDKVVEDTLKGNAPYCIFFITSLFATGFGMPFTHYFFHGAFKEVTTVAMTAGIIKLAFAFGMTHIMMNNFLKADPGLKKMLAAQSKENAPGPDAETAFFKLRKRRKQLCRICPVPAILALISSAFSGFGAR